MFSFVSPGRLLQLVVDMIADIISPYPRSPLREQVLWTPR